MNALIFGCGSKFGLTLRHELEKSGYTVWGVTGQSTDSDQLLQVNWTTCDIADFEKFLRKLPSLDLIVFNQNANAVTDNYWQLSGTHIFEIWKNAKSWKQNYYVNSILPTHVLQTLSSSGKIQEHARVIWMLSTSMFGHTDAPAEYVGHKYQNYINLKKLAQLNSQQFLGICPGLLNADNYTTKANLLIDFTKQITPNDSGKFYAFDNASQQFKLHPVDQ